MKFDGTTYEPNLDSTRLETLLNRVKSIMLDGKWRTLTELHAHLGGSEASISARLRDLRKESFGGYTVERRRRGNPEDGLFEYRVLVTTLQMNFDNFGQGAFL